MDVKLGKPGEKPPKGGAKGSQTTNANAQPAMPAMPGMEGMEGMDPMQNRGRFMSQGDAIASDCIERRNPSEWCHCVI